MAIRFQKYLFLLIIIANMAVQTSCRDYFDTYWMPEAVIQGHINYTVNPFDSTDSILCFTNISTVFLGGNDSTYFSYLINLLSECGRIDNNNYLIYDHKLRFYPYKEAIFYLIRNKQFYSVIDKQTGNVSDSVTISSLSWSYWQQRNPKWKYWEDTKKMHFQTICMQHRGFDTQYKTGYLDDEYIFWGSDNGNPRFISDTITPTGQRLVCIEVICGGTLEPTDTDETISTNE